MNIMTYQAVFIAIAMTAAAGNVSAQNQEPHDDSLANVVDVAPLRASPAEIRFLDKLAAGRDLLIKPSRVLSYWPEYSYRYDDVIDRFDRKPIGESDSGESPCDIAREDQETGDFNIGTIAVIRHNSDSAEQYPGHGEQTYSGWPIVHEENHDSWVDIPWSANDNSWSLSLEEFCTALQVIKSAADNGVAVRDLVNANVGGFSGINIANHDFETFNLQENSFDQADYPNNWYFVTSQALPYKDLQFERVRISPPL